MANRETNGARLTNSRLPLLSYCGSILSYVLNLRRTNVLPKDEVPRLRDALSRLLQAFEHEARRQGYANEDVLDIEFALAAFVDETVGSSGWEGRNAYLEKRLTHTLFRESDAGVVFFERLSAARQDLDRRREVVEVYFICLALGFEGKYAFEEDTARRSFVQDLGRSLQSDLQEQPWFSRRAYPETRETVPRTGIRLSVVWLTAAAIVFVTWLGLTAAVQFHSDKVGRDLGRIEGRR